MRTHVPLLTPDGRSLELYLAGPEEAMPLLFHHGTPGTGAPFPGMVEGLVKHGLRFVGWSRPGYGSSSRQIGRDVASAARDAATILDHIGRKRAYVLGWSGGGPHVLACAALLPDRVIAAASIASLAPYRADGIEFDPVEDVVATAALAGPDALDSVLHERWPYLRAMTAQTFVEQIGPELASEDQRTLPAELAEWVALLFRHGLRESYWGWLDDELAFARPWDFDLGAITVPVHIWHGRDDQNVTPTHGEWLGSHVSRACSHFTLRDGHFSFFAPENLGAILDELTAEG